MTHERVQQALADIRAGRMVILVDDEDRENEGDLCMAAAGVTPEAINFMALHARGLICLTLTEERLEALQVPMMVQENTSTYNTAFTVSIEARQGVTTGISAADRAHTIKVAIDPATQPQDLVRPGHMFPLRARRGGVLVRTGQTEGSVDLARLAGMDPSGVICEIMNDDGTMARMPDLESFARRHGVSIVSIAELIEYRLAHDSLVRRLTERRVAHPRWGELSLMVYGTAIDEHQHLAVIKGTLDGEAPLVRMQAGTAFMDAMGDVLGDGPGPLDEVMAHLTDAPTGVLVCIDRGTPEQTLEARVNSLGAVSSDVPPSAAAAGVLRELGVGAQILRDLGLSHLRLLSNHPRRLVGLEGYGLRVDEVVALEPAPAKKPLEVLHA